MERISAREGSAWLGGRSWDLTWIIGSAVVVPLSLLFVWGGISSDAMNLVVTLLVGGPHVFSTFLVTYLDPEYRRGRGPALAFVAIAVVAFVVWMTMHHFQVLMSFFIFAASFHVLQQNAFLAHLYRGRAGRPEGLVAMLIDTALLFLSFYPIASAKLVHNDFLLGEIPILIPGIFRTEATIWVVSTLFGAAILLFVGKTLREWRRGTLNAPKTALITLTSLVAFLVPAAASGTRLELAFQTVNVWHSVQYLAMIWLVLAARRRDGPALSPFLRSVSGPGRATARFYAWCFAFTSALLAVIVLLHWTDPLKLSTPQYYYMTVFSALFIHYAFDGTFFLMSRRRGVKPEGSPFTRLARTAS